MRQKIIAKIQDKMNRLVLFRGEKKDIIAKLNEIKIRDEEVVLEAFEEPIDGNDLGFNTNLGKIGDTYLDYEIYLLPTMEEGHFIITEVNPF